MNFIPGLKLSEYFLEQAIRPLLQEYYPDLPYSAARLEWGSDVIGFDTAMSMDHGWGPKMTLFLTEEEFPTYHKSLDDFFADNLPFDIHGFSTHFGEPLADGGVMAPRSTTPIHHMITITTPERFFADTLGVNIHQPITPSTWLTIPQQRLLTVRAGRIYHDGLGTLTGIRQQFNWYPRDLWHYLLANQWQRIDQDAPFLGRTGIVGDELGSRLLAARLVTDLMHLAFLMEKQYAPYRKWFGSAFQNLEVASELLPLFDAILKGTDWQERESHLSKAYIFMIEHHNALGLTPCINPQVINFHNRPFLVPPAAEIVDALLAEIKDPAVQALPPRLGSVNQIADNTDLLENLDRCQKLGAIYQQSQD
jgi:hypothetical protein